MIKRLSVAFVLAVMCFMVACGGYTNEVVPPPPLVTGGVFTEHNNNARTGQNLNEITLTTANVNVSQFGKLFKQTVDDQVFAQPLYASGATISGVKHNVIIVATENDTVYAFDADGNMGVNANPLWTASLADTSHGGATGESALIETQSTMCTDIAPHVGVTGTPVIDSTTSTIYVESFSAVGFNYFHKLHALDLATGYERSGSPVSISATVSGYGLGSTNGLLPFNNLTQINRSALLLANNSVYVAYGSLCDKTPASGWIFKFTESPLALADVFVSAPNGSLGAIWGSGGGPASDSSGNVYVPTGNGSYDTSSDYGDTVLKLSPDLLTVLDSFTPYNQAYMQANDSDLGSGGLMLLPDQPGPTSHLLVAAGKLGRIFVVNRDQFTTGNSHYCSSCNSVDTEIAQETALNYTGGIFGSPAYWNGNVYYIGANSGLLSIPVTSGSFGFTNTTASTIHYSWPGGIPTISASASTNGIVWFLSTQGLTAYNASNITTPLWISSQASAGRDTPGPFIKFSIPTIINGKVYVGANGEVDVYGLFN